MIGGNNIKRKKLLVKMLVILTFITLFSASTAVCAGKAYIWLIMDGDDPLSVFLEYTDTWIEPNLQRTTHFEWLVYREGSRAGGSQTESGQGVGGAKAIISMTGFGNDLQLNIQIYKGNSKNPSFGPEIYQWNIINGKDAVYDTINAVFIDTITGKTSKTISLNDGDIITTGIPQCSEFDCNMWLI